MTTGCGFPQPVVISGEFQKSILILHTPKPSQFFLPATVNCLDFLAAEPVEVFGQFNRARTKFDARDGIVDDEMCLS